jgi:hypothetical protein
MIGDGPSPLLRPLRYRPNLHEASQAPNGVMPYWRESYQGRGSIFVAFPLIFFSGEKIPLSGLGLECA